MQFDVVDTMLLEVLSLKSITRIQPFEADGRYVIGFLEGVIVGIKVGAEGITEGTYDGAVGVIEGTREGIIVGTFDGAAVGVAVKFILYNKVLVVSEDRD